MSPQITSHVKQVEGGGDEDEGWLMDFVYFPSNHSSAWIVWDARQLFHIVIIRISFVGIIYHWCYVRDLLRVATG